MSETASDVLANYRRIRSVFWQDGPNPVILPQPDPQPVTVPTRSKEAETEPPARDVLHIASTPSNPRRRRTVDTGRGRAIAVEVAEAFGLKMTDMVSSRRDKVSSLARHVAMWRMRRETPLSLPQIGVVLGGKDHTTVLHGIRRIDRLIAEGKAVVG